VKLIGLTVIAIGSFQRLEANAQVPPDFFFWTKHTISRLTGRVYGGVAMSIRCYIETGAKRAFACCFDWPGWCRSGKDESLAVESLAAYTTRYAPIAAKAGYPLPHDVRFEVVERVPGSPTTDFGALSAIAADDRTAMTSHAAERIADLVVAVWKQFDAVVAGAPAELRKGPRGGGRDRDKIAAHVLAAETMYARKVGVHHREPAVDDREAVEELRAAILESLRSPESIVPPSGWPAAYAARRIAWHVLDHAWEIEDRSP
jgi:hypothetical protein